jgi:PPOX class probable F420-dependent enzyme
LVSAVDHKPKTTERLQRLANIERDPRVTVLIDHYDDADWGSLWWVRLAGVGAELAPDTPRNLALGALVDKYPQYQEMRPDGPVLAITITSVLGWSAGTQ